MMVVMDDDWRVHQYEGWRVSLPPGVTGGPVERLTNPEVTTMSVFRGWAADRAMFVGVSARPREFSSLRMETRKVSRWFHGGAVDGELVEVPGVRGGARRVDGLMDVEEGYGEAPDWTEKVTCVVAARGRHEVVVLTLRRHPAADLDDVVDRIAGSFALTS
jgi:hypothetical protein